MPLVSFCLNNNEEVNNSKHVVKKILVNGCCNTVESLKDKMALEPPGLLLSRKWSQKDRKYKESVL